jgi:hypothetical protein
VTRRVSANPDKLRCSVCERDRPVGDFPTIQEVAKPLRYHSRCKRCREIFNSLRVREADGTISVPNQDTLRQIVRANPDKLMKAVGRSEGKALKSHGHKAKREEKLTSDPEVQHALGVLRDARAQVAGRQGYVYCIGERESAYGVKIGYSTNPEARVVELQTGNPRTLVLLAKIRGDEELERRFHTQYRALNICGEWFRPAALLLSAFRLKTSLVETELGHKKEVIVPA